MRMTELLKAMRLNQWCMLVNRQDITKQIDEIDEMIWTYCAKHYTEESTDPPSLL